MEKRDVWTLKTETTSAEAWLMFLKKSTRRVFGSASVRITGVRWRKTGLKAAIAWLIEAPRPAKASPKPLSAVRELSRVFRAKVEKTSSYSAASHAALARWTVSPAL